MAAQIARVARAAYLGFHLSENKTSRLAELRATNVSTPFSGRPTVSVEADRAYLIASLECCDAVVLFGTPENTDACPLIERLRPDVYAKGGDYTLETIHPVERRLLERLGCRIEFVSLVPGLSTTELIRRVTLLAPPNLQDNA